MNEEAFLASVGTLHSRIHSICSIVANSIV